MPSERSAGIVNLSGRGMLVVSVARQLGLGNSFARLLCCPAQAERGRKTRPWSVKLTMPTESFLLTQGPLEMNTGHFEQIADCWSAEQQSAIYYRTIAARARKLQADATTPRVRQYFDTMIVHCERLAGRVEPGALSSESVPIGRSKKFFVQRGPRNR